MKSLPSTVAVMFGIVFLNIAYCATDKLSMLYSFDPYKEGTPNSNIITNDDGKSFYGHTDSVIYKFDAISNQFTLIQHSRHASDNENYSFEGNLTLDPNMQFIYGLESAFKHDAIFKLSLDGKLKQYLHEFDLEKRFAEGYDPVGNVVISSDGKTVYGATESGGINPVRSKGGVIYQIKLDKKNAVYKVLHAFSANEDGGTPNGRLVLSADGHFLYGTTTQASRPNYCGTLFRLSIDGSESPAFETLRHFNCDADQPRLNSLVISKNGNTLYASSTLNYGSIIKIDLTKPGFPTTLLHKFSQNDEGLNPVDIALSQDETALIGVSTGGQTKWNFYYANIFKVSLSNHENNYSIIYQFTDINEPYSPLNLILNKDNSKIYGMSEFGGHHNAGTIFQYNLQ